MENNTQLIDTLLISASEYGKTSFELVKLKTIDKTSDAISTVLPFTFVLALLSCFFLFINLGLALWIGDILGKMYYGFLLVGAFYGFVGVVSHFFLHNWLKKIFCNYIIKKMLN